MNLVLVSGHFLSNVMYTGAGAEEMYLFSGNIHSLSTQCRLVQYLDRRSIDTSDIVLESLAWLKAVISAFVLPTLGKNLHRLHSLPLKIGNIHRFFRYKSMAMFVHMSVQVAG